MRLTKPNAAVSGPRTYRSIIVAAGLAFAAAAAIASAGPERTLHDAVYTKAQARAGKKLYGQHCIGCHERGYFREVLLVHQGETLEPLFETMLTEMPQNEPGSLTDGEYLDLMAYIISQSRYATGTEPLSLGDIAGILIPAP